MTAHVLSRITITSIPFFDIEHDKIDVGDYYKITEGVELYE